MTEVENLTDIDIVDYSNQNDLSRTTLLKQKSFQNMVGVQDGRAVSPLDFDYHNHTKAMDESLH